MASTIEAGLAYAGGKIEYTQLIDQPSVMTSRSSARRQETGAGGPHTGDGVSALPENPFLWQRAGLPTGVSRFQRAGAGESIDGLAWPGNLIARYLLLRLINSLVTFISS